jgi:hypothetical protein
VADEERGSGLSAAWGVVAALTGAGAVAVWIAARTTGTHVPIWPAYPLGAVAVIALYLTFASVLGLPPVRGRREIASSGHEVSRPKLMVTILADSEFENWRYIALIAALHVQVENTTDRPVLVGGYAFTYDAGGEPSWETQEPGQEVMSLQREISRRNERQQYGQPLRNFARIPARETISGWFLTAVSRPPTGGTPAGIVIISDDVRNEYRATLPRREPQIYG